MLPTQECLQTRPKLAVSFVDQLTRSGVALSGAAKIVWKNDPKFAKFSKPYKALWPELSSMFNAVVVIELTKVKPLRAPAYDIGATRDDLRETWFSRIRDINIKHFSQEKSEC